MPRKVWRCLHFYPVGQENHCLPGNERQRVYLERQIEGCECRGGVHASYHASFWQRRCLRLSQFEANGTKEGMSATVAKSSKIRRGDTPETPVECRLSADSCLL